MPIQNSGFCILVHLWKERKKENLLPSLFSTVSLHFLYSFQFFCAKNTCSFQITLIWCPCGHQCFSSDDIDKTGSSCQNQANIISHTYVHFSLIIL